MIRVQIPFSYFWNELHLQRKIVNWRWRSKSEKCSSEKGGYGAMYHDVFSFTKKFDIAGLVYFMVFLPCVLTGVRVPNQPFEATCTWYDIIILKTDGAIMIALVKVDWDDVYVQQRYKSCHFALTDDVIILIRITYVVNLTPTYWFSYFHFFFFNSNCLTTTSTCKHCAVLLGKNTYRISYMFCIKYLYWWNIGCNVIRSIKYSNFDTPCMYPLYLWKR